MATDQGSWGYLLELLQTQGLAVLATHRQGQPYTNLVSFVALDGGRRLCFATPRATRKFASLMQDNRVALMIDNRTIPAPDLANAMAVNATGHAREVAAEEQADLRRRLLARHPALSEFLAQPDCALIAVEVDRYSVVRGLDDVREWVWRAGSFAPER